MRLWIYILHFFKQKNVVHASNVASGLLFYRNMGWYRQAFYPMSLANHHELLKDYFRLFHKHNPEHHAMNIIIHIDTFSGTIYYVHFPVLELSTLCFFFSKTKVEVNVFFLCCWRFLNESFLSRHYKSTFTDSKLNLGYIVSIFGYAKLSNVYIFLILKEKLYC